MKFLCSSLFLFVFITSFAQQSSLVKIQGFVFDSETNSPLEYATISFKDSKGDRIFLGALTNSKGKFSVEIAKGNYQITVEYLGFQHKTIVLVVSKNSHLGKINLKPSNEQLNEVVVSSQKSILLKKGTISLLVNKDISSKGSNAFEILNNIPSVNSDISGSIKVDGYKDATILINGRSSALSKVDVLKTISANSVEKIDVISHPGAQYKASNTAIINIILKKGKNEGLHGSVTTTAGYKDHYGALVNIQHKNKKVNIYANISSSYKKDDIKTRYNNEYYKTDGSPQSYLNQVIDYTNTKHIYFMNIGAEYKLNSVTSINTNLNAYSIRRDANTLTFSNFFSNSLTSTSQNNLDKSLNYEDLIIEAQMGIQHQFKNGASFNFEVSHTLDKENYQNNFINSNGSIQIANTTEKNKLNNSQIATKYTLPLNKQWTFTTGYDGEFGKTPFDHLSDAQNYHINYKENIHAGFMEFEYEKESWYVGLGLRGEHFDVSVDYTSLNINQNKKYNNLFPSVYIQKELTDKAYITLDYTSKISRPSFYKIQPFEQVYSETNSYIGNPNLKPFFIDNYAISYTYSTSKLTLRPRLQYSKFKDPWRDVSYQTGVQIDGVSKIITQPYNVGDLNYFVANLTAMLRVSNQLNFTFSTNLMHLVNNGVFTIRNTTNTPISIDYNHANTNADFSLVTSLTIPKWFSIQSRLYHALDSNGPVSKRENYSYATLSLSKEILGNNGTLSFTTSDLFNTNQTNRRYFNNYYTSNVWVKNSNPTYLMSFTYRFNQRKKRQKIDFNKKDIKPIF